MRMTESSTPRELPDDVVERLAEILAGLIVECIRAERSREIDGPNKSGVTLDRQVEDHAPVIVPSRRRA